MIYKVFLSISLLLYRGLHFCSRIDFFFFFFLFGYYSSCDLQLLDDNRELFVTELNTVVKAHKSFRLFATQNPVSTYAGRKPLSRALLNRFIVLRFDHLPFSELAQIVVARLNLFLY